MNQSKIAVRYSKALFSLAEDKNLLDVVYNDMLLIFATCKDPNFNDFLENLVIVASKKKVIVEEIFGKKIHDISLSFMNQIITNRRESYLKNISLKFIEDYKKHKGIKSAHLITAAEIDRSIENNLIKHIEDNLKSKVELDASINKNLIGGYILTLEDKRIDASVSTQLNEIKKELISDSY